MKKLVLLCCMVLFLGCATMPHTNYDFIDEWCAFLHESGDATTKCGLESVVFIKATLGIELYKLDAEALLVLNQMESIYRSTNELTPVQKAELAGLWARFFTRLSTQAIEAIGPEVVKFLIKI